jgi:hypothetical protein
MPIHECPLTKNAGGSLVAYLPVTIVNPHTGQKLRTQGIIDTGADECAIPARAARIIGHKLKAGTPSKVTTGNGTAIAWSHTTIILVHHPETEEVIFNSLEVPIDYMKVPSVLLGVRSFLNRFVFTVDYPRRVFSLVDPFKGP